MNERNRRVGILVRAKSALNYLVFTLVVLAMPISLAMGAGRSGYATAHDGTDIYFEVHGTGPKFLLFGFTLQPRSPELQEFIDGLGHDYKLVVAEYPGDPKMYTLTPAAVARDYLAIARAAGAEEFAFYGYSWGASCGLQLALRTDRVRALVAGGFPMIGGPYMALRDTLQKRVFENASLPSGWKHNWEEARQLLTYYEGLQSFDDRLIQKKLTMPRLNFVGTKDHVMFYGGIDVEFNNIFAKYKKDIEAAGWDVIAMQGEDHSTAMSPKVSIPLIRQWLKDNWRD